MNALTMSLVAVNPKDRIIALYIQYRDREGVPDNVRRRLYHHAKLTRREMDDLNRIELDSK